MTQLKINVKMIDVDADGVVSVEDVKLFMGSFYNSVDDFDTSPKRTNQTVQTNLSNNSSNIFSRDLSRDLLNLGLDKHLGSFSISKAQQNKVDVVTLLNPRAMKGSRGSGSREIDDERDSDKFLQNVQIEAFMDLYDRDGDDTVSFEEFDCITKGFVNRLRALNIIKNTDDNETNRVCSEMYCKLKRGRLDQNCTVDNIRENFFETFCTKNENSELYNEISELMLTFCTVHSSIVLRANTDVLNYQQESIIWGVLFAVGVLVTISLTLVISI
ncbi:hypothetical protein YASMINEVIRUS_1066 [Yasminevirus sp. GU-2018]|uniref:EF-hand domain-containing protein n=1 Tax=Yasminevirus sp. GU-2018 TaxID=2420051 RepID=A0A5K0UAU5_9VIRU|nr:hypothetical protein YASMINEVIRUS_1066 [Yasminevirus sp. GU-2018]